MANKTICLVTNWYPTKENPYVGSFFKEQAFAVASYYDFVVFHYTERRALFSSLTNRLECINQEKNTKEYSLSVRVSFFYDLLNVITSFSNRLTGKNNEIGPGKHLSPTYLRHKSNIIKRVLSNNSLDFDVLYCVDAQYEAGLLSIISEISGKPYVVSEHSPVPPPGLLISDFNYYAIEKANLFLAISYDKIRQLMMQNITLPKTHYIGNMVDEDKFSLINTKDHDIKCILIVGANSFYKNYPMFCDVIEKLYTLTDVPFKVIIAGYGANKGYAKNVEDFEKSMLDSVFSERLELIPEVKRGYMQEVYKKADVFVMTSLQEGQPLAALEAACCGVPIYSTRCGGVEDYVDEKTGRIYNVTDVEGMAEGLRDFIEGRVTYDPVYIRDRVVKHYGKESFINSFHKAFDDVISMNEVSA